MEINKAIEFMETFKDKVTDMDMENGDAEMMEEYNNEISKVISLLQQGEAYQQIVEDIEYELNWHKPEEPLFTAKLEVSKDEEYCNEILDLITNIKQKYFPKEVDHEYPESEE